MKRPDMIGNKLAVGNKGNKTSIKKGQHLSPETEFKKGQRPPHFIGRTRDVYGYISIYSPDHPNRTKQNRVKEHRLVMEKYIGRYLTRREVVHHINGIRDDNRIENLLLLRSQSEHFHLEEHPHRNHLNNSEYRVCATCKIRKELNKNNLATSPSQTLGFIYHCKPCHNKKTRDYKRKKRLEISRTRPPRLGAD
jgi:hypothetical protein